MASVEVQSFEEYLLYSDALGSLKAFVPGIYQPSHRRVFSHTEAKLSKLARPVKLEPIALRPKLTPADLTQQQTHQKTSKLLRRSMKSTKLNMVQCLRSTGSKPLSNKSSQLFASFKLNLLNPPSSQTYSHRRNLSQYEPERQFVIYSKFNRKPRPEIDDSQKVSVKLTVEKRKHRHQLEHMQEVVDIAAKLFDLLDTSSGN